MEHTKCKQCKYFSQYYHGYGVNTITFSERCWWTIKDPEKVSDDECHFERKEDDR